MAEEKKFETLQEELEPYKAMLSKAQEIIMEKEVSSYPIFVFHQHDMEIGIEIANKDKNKGNWNVHASSMEEFISKSIIQNEKIQEFKDVYKDTDTHLCLFVISELGAQFIFLEK